MGNTIRIAHTGDAATISAIFYASSQWAYRGILPDSFLESTTPDFWTADLEKDLSSGTRFGLVLEKDGAPAGTGVMRTSNFAFFPNDGELISLYLLSDEVGAGLGKTLILACKELLRARGYAHCVLDVFQGNDRARRFYDALGYQLTSHSVTQVVGEVEVPLAVLRKPL